MKLKLLYIFLLFSYLGLAKSIKEEKKGSNFELTSFTKTNNKKALSKYNYLNAYRINVGLYYESELTPITPDTNNILYVNKNVSGGDGSGDSWTNAVPELADALLWARTQHDADNNWLQNDSLQVFVAKGVYKPLYNAADGNYTTNGNRDNAFVMVNNVQLYGGFAGSEVNLSDRDLSLAGNATVLSGDIGGLNDLSDNVYHVVVDAGNVGAALLDGFTITGGNANDNVSSIAVNANSIRRDYGGGMYNAFSSSSSLTNVTITGNTAAGYGGGMYNASSSPNLTNITITGNTANHGGGIYNSQYSSLSLTNVAIVGNTANHGGGIYNYFYSSSSLTNVTIVGNTANSGDGIHNQYESSLTINNSIVWGTISNISLLYTPNYSLIQDNTNTANGNIDATGLTAEDIFTDPANGDYTLKLSSPAINAGSNTLYTDAGGDLNNDTDLTGNPRLFGNTIDIGAYEYDGILADFTISGGYCIGNAVTFTDNSSSPNGAIVSWEWDFGDGTTSTKQNPTHSYADLGNFTILLKVTDVIGETNSITKSFNVQRPKARFTANPTRGQATPHTVFFTDQSTLPDRWFWEFGNGYTSTAQNPIHTYTAAGDYTVNLTVKDTINGCVDKVTSLIKIVIPKAQFSVDDTLGCGPFSVNFTDKSTIEGNDTVGEWLWNFGDGNTSTEQNPTHTYESVGVYNVSLTIKTTITGFTRTETKANFIQVIGLTPDFSSDITTGCTPLTVNFTDNTVFYGPSSDWFWDFGDGNTSNATSPKHTYTTAGVFDVSLTVTDIDGCSKTIIKKAYINTTEAIAPTVLIQNITVSLDASGVATITAADIDKGSYDNCEVASMSLDKTSFDCLDVGANTVTLTVTDTSGNSNTATAIVTVEDIIAPTVMCQDITVPLDASGIVTITAADIDNGSIDSCGIASMSLDKTTFDCSSVGINTVTLTVEDINGNTNSCGATVTVEDITPPTVMCQDITVPLDASGIVTITAADIDNGSIDSCGIASMSLDKTTFDCSSVGINTVTLTVEDTNGNTNSCVATVTVEDVTPPEAICQDITVSLDASGTVTITAADIDNGSNDTCGIASISIDKTTFDSTNVGINTVALTVEDTNGNTNTCTANITVEDVTPPMAITKDIVVSLDSNGNAIINPEDIDDGSYDASGIASMSLSQTNFNCPNLTDYTVALTVIDSNGLSSSEEAVVTFISDDLDNDSIADVCDNDIDGDEVLNINDNCPRMSNPDQKDLDNNGIGDVCDSSELSVYNGFSPNGDGVNDVFVVEGLHNYPNNKLEIYNRWGNRVYHSYNYQNDWNGISKNQGKKLPAGVYFYMLTIEENSRNLKGWVYIIY
ncbi:PKD domain-containing protein [Tenacibaculum sp. Ill]|uniref:PKD domain-containing protein n=1 Tax=Tenacibaculum sp. Ill TaxID=3445935 RepID=UPI003F7AC15F